MKKRFLLTFSVVILQIMLYAGNIVTLYEDINAKSIGHRYEVPVVVDEGASITIASDTLVSDVHVLIKDVSGTVISDEVVTLLPSENTICIPEEYKNDKYSIELYYDEKCFYGYFDKP